MHRISCLLLLILVLLAIFPVKVEAATETRYFRNDEVFGLTQTSSSDSVSIDASGKRSIYWGVKVYKVDSGGSATEITSGVVQVCARTSDGAGEQDGTWACPVTALASTDHIRVEVWMKIGTGSYGLKVTFNSEDLGVSQLDSATWTFHYDTSRYWDSDSNWTAGDLLYGVSSSNSRVTNFVTSTTASGSWHSVTWTFDLTTRTWSSLSWTFDLNTRQWFPFYWNLDLHTRQWNSLSWMWTLITRAWSGQSWTFEIGGKMWNHESWTFDLVTRGWNRQSWTFGLLSKMWNPQYWTFDLLTRGWNQQSWTFDLTTRTWHGQSWMLDLLGRAWSHQFWSFDFIQKEWTHVYRFFNINVRQWNMQNWNFEFAEAFNPGMQGLLLLGILAVIAVIIIAYKHPHIPINL